jgi:DNA repair exonuclease SbcCD ATPase subunit
MEEKTEKKTTKKKSLDENKIKEAKKKVNELLAGTGLEDKEEEAVFTPPVQQQEDEFIGNPDQATTWLNEQVAALSQQVENYEKVIAQLRTDNQNMMNMLNNGGGSGNINNSSLEAKVIEVYKHFENVYTGRKYGQPFADAKLSWPQGNAGVLDMLLATFPFLHNVREYRHRG